MSHFTSCILIRALFTLPILLIIFPNLNAQDHYWNQQYGGKATLTGGTEVAGSGDNSALYYNPGSIGFIDSTRITASTYIYGFEYIYLKNGAGNGIDLKNIRANIIPQLLAGSIAIKKVPRLKLIVGTLTRGRTNVRFNQEREGFYEVIAGSPGLEYYKARVEHQYNSVEQWAGLGLAYKISQHWSVGLSSFGAYTHIEVRATENTSADGLVNGTPYSTSVNEFNSLGLNQFMHVFKLGVAARYKHVQFGAALTLPGIRVWGQGKLEKSFEVYNLNQNPSDTNMAAQKYNSYVISDVQRRLKTQYRIPLSASAGFKLVFPNVTFSFAAEYFMGYKDKTVIQGQDRVVVRPASIYAHDTIEGFMTVKTTARSVINAGIGAEVKITPILDVLLGLRTDFSNRAEFLPNNAVIGVTTARSPNWDYLHFSHGFNYKLPLHTLTVGLDYGFGFSTNKEQVFNLSDPQQNNFLRGQPVNNKLTIAHRVDFILSYTYFFQKKEKSHGPFSMVEEIKKARKQKKAERAKKKK